MSSDSPISSEHVAVLLASALGQDKSDEIVATTVRALGITRATYTGEDVRAIFERLAKSEGLVGVVARFAVSRGDVEKLAVRADALAPPSHRSVGGPVPETLPPTVDIMHLLAPALGTEKARDAIEAAAARRGVDTSKGLSHAVALAVLDEMTTVEGIVGVVARFAKARFLLNPNG